MLLPIFNTDKGPMKVVGLISGSGTRLIDLLEHQAKLEAKGGTPYKVVGVFSENPDSRAREIAERYQLPVVIRNLRAFCSQHGVKITDLKAREEFDRQTVHQLAAFEADAAAFAGYVWVATAPLIEAFIGINGHPADLSIVRDGKRAYAGADGVGAALASKEKELFATTHLVTSEVDGGPILIISKPVTVEQDPGMTDRQRWRKYLNLVNNRLSEIFPLAIEKLASGQFERDKTGVIHYKSRPIPDGLRL